jgi:hypothetical protein
MSPKTPRDVSGKDLIKICQNMDIVLPVRREAILE